MINLPLPKSGKINYIIHASDIHIRNGTRINSRYNEYTNVFNRLYNNLNNLSQSTLESTVIVLTGDFFHQKNKIDSASTYLFNNLIGNLSKFAPVYIIQGNHDFRQDLTTDTLSEPFTFDSDIEYDTDIDQLDSHDVLTSLFHLTERENVAYLADSGCYIAGDIGFGLVSVKDTLVSGGTHAQVEKLPDFPNTFPQHVKTKIALFHGTMKQSTLQNYSPANDGYPTDWIKGYDLWLLGDVHLQQIHNVTPINNQLYSWNNNQKPVWGYSGSLIQQTFGETLTGHGYLLWNLIDKTVLTQDIHNNIARISAKFINNHWIIKNEGKWSKKHPITFLQYINTYKLPKFAVIKTEGKYTNSDIETLNNILEKTNIKFEINQTAIYNSTNIAIDNLESFNSTESWIEYIENKCTESPILNNKPWKKWLKEPDTLLIPSNQSIVENIKTTIESRNKVLEKKITNLQNSTAAMSNKKNLSLLYLRWKWLFCYGAENYFDFQQADGHITQAKGDNSDGKTSFFEIIVLALFGKQMPSRADKKYSYEVICTQKPENTQAHTHLEFILDQKQYLIHRKYECKKKSAKLEVESMLYIFDPETNAYNLYKSSITAINSWFESEIGISIEHFLLSIMITQGNDCDFFKLTPEAQISLLDKALDLDRVEKLDDLLSETIKAHEHIIKITQPLYSTLIKQHFDENQLRQVTDSLQTHTKQRKILENAYESLYYSYTNINDLNLQDEEIQLRIDELTNKIQSITVSESYEKLLQESGKYDNLLTQFDNDIEIINEKSAIELQSELTQLIENKPTKPNIDEYIKLKSPKKPENNDINGLIKQKHESLARIAQFEIDIQKSFKDRPNKPECDIHSVTKLKREYQSIVDEFKQWTQDLVFDLTQNPLQKPSISQSDIDELQSTLDNEIQEIKWISMSKTELNQMIDEQNTLLSKHNSEKDLLLQDLEKTQSQLNNNNKIIEKEQLSIKNLGTPPKIEYSSDVCNNWLNLYAEKSKIQQKQKNFLHHSQNLLDKYKQIHELQSAITDCNIRIKEYSDVEYNPQCDACLKNPGRIKLIELQDKSDKYTQKLNNLQTQLNLDINIDDYLEKHNKCKQWIEEFSQDEKVYSIWIERLDTAQQYDQYTRAKQFHQENLDKLNKEQNYLYNQMQKLQQQINSMQDNIIDVQSTLKSISYTFNNIDRWQQTKDIIDNANQDIIQYQQKLPLHNLVQKYNQLLPIYNQALSQEKLIYDYDSWTNNHEKIEITKKQAQDSQQNIIAQIDIVNQYNHWQQLHESYTKWKNWENRVQKIQYTIYSLQKTNINTKIENLKQVEEWEISLKYWKDIKNIKPIHQKKMEIKSQINNINNLIQNILNDKSCLDKDKQQFLNEQKSYHLYTEFIDLLTDRIESFAFLKKLFIGFKKYLYTKKIIPKLTYESNKIVKYILNTDHQLDYDIDNGNENKLIVHWKTTNGNNSSGILRSGGYVSFIFGLTIRIAISRIGASMIACNQIFIDEGFVAGSIDSLEKIPYFINHLKTIYNTVVIVTHTDIIQQTSTLTVPIQKLPNSQLSQIIFGKSRAFNTNKKNPCADKIISKNDNEFITSNCIMITSKGTQCKSRAKLNEDYCRRHCNTINLTKKVNHNA